VRSSVLFFFFWTASCSLLTDVDSLKGGPNSEGGTDGGAETGMDAAPPPPPPPTCKTDGFACVAEAPSGWTGPFALFDGLATSAPTCAGATPVQVLASNADLVPAAPAKCAACACTASGVTCKGNFAVDGDNGGCTACNTPGTMTPNVCHSYTYGTVICGGYNATNIRFTGSATVNSGTCAPDVAKPTPTKDPFSFNRAEIGCQGSVTRVDCDSGYVCANTTKPPFAKGLCISHAGDLPACPGAPYSQRFLFNQSATDTRDCAACTCGATPDALACTATVVSSASDSSCQTGTMVTVPGCSSNYPGYAKLTIAPPGKTTCPASGGAPVGTVTGSDPVTVCCIP